MGAQILRLFRVIRIVRLMVEYGKSALSDDLRRNRAGSALATASLLVVLVLQFGSYFIIGIEAKSPQANIVNPFDALWWSLVTIATVGYGDLFPVTTNGRLLGTLVILSGVFLFSVLTGFLARKFFSAGEEQQPSLEMQQSLNEIQSLLEEQKDSIAELEIKVSKIEKGFKG
jgi:voltage-gated potassium channel